jgi:hypothetical protein
MRFSNSWCSSNTEPLFFCHCYFYIFNKLLNIESNSVFSRIPKLFLVSLNDAFRMLQGPRPGRVSGESDILLEWTMIQLFFSDKPEEFTIGNCSVWYSLQILVHLTLCLSSEDMKTWMELLMAFGRKRPRLWPGHEISSQLFSKSYPTAL